MIERRSGAFAGRTAIVTGGLRGIGWEVANGFAGIGANVAIIDRDEVGAPQVYAANRQSAP